MRAKDKRLKESSKNENICELYTDNNEFKKGYQSWIKKDDGTADTSSILSKWEEFYSNLLNVHHSRCLEGNEICKPAKRN